MKLNISAALGGISVEKIGIKGKTTEKLGFTGRGEGIAAQAVCLICFD
jgi:2C-methyl-D-erythritol 2,4-cyclodiphosphate synthase